VISRRSRVLLLFALVLGTLGTRAADAAPSTPNPEPVIDVELPGPIGGLSLGAAGSLGTAGATPGTTYAGFVTLPRPERLLDTRTGNGAPIGPIGPGSQVTVQLAGRGGVPADADAVVMNVTADAPSVGGYLTVFPAGTAVPGTSNLNLVPGRTVANLVVMRLNDGKAAFANAFGTTHVLADVLAYSRADGNFVGFAPERFLDTRAGVGAPTGKVGPAGRIDVSVLGVAGVPLDPAKVSAVVVNLTADSPTTPSFVTAWPSGAAMPNASSLNFAAGQTVANLVFAPVGADGRISLANERGDVHLVGDIVGWIPSGAAYIPITPVRVLDTRTGLGGETRLQGRDLLYLDLRSRYPYPYTVGAVVLNVTAAGPTEASFLTVFPGTGGSAPDTSNINTVAGENTANAVVVRPSAVGLVAIANERGTTDVVVDLVGVIPLQNAADLVADAGGSRFHVLYVLGSDGGEDPTMVANIRTELELATQWFASETGTSIDLDRTGGQINVTTWRLPNFTNAQLLRWEEQPNYAPLTQLAEDGFGFPDGRRYLVYIDGASTNGYCGLAYGVFATVYQSGGCGNVLAPVTTAADVGATVNTAQVALHEMLHALGAVPPCAPNGVTFHANDTAADLMWPVIGTGKHVDIGRDDYFGHANAGCLDVADSRFLATNPG
jgi:hypothetical protein